jgi:hypothetical protein
MGDVLGYIIRAALGRIKGDDADRIIVLARNEILDNCFQVCGFVVGFAPGRGLIFRNLALRINGLLVAAWDDRRRPSGFTHDKLDSKRTGTQM